LPLTLESGSFSAALLVPCYNATRFLPRLREQIDRLNPPFDEVLLADDASEDDTAAVASAMGFPILRMPFNKGPGAVRNRLARASSAEWIHFHDVDDEIAPDYLDRIRPLAKSEYDVVFHFVDFIDEHTREIVIPWIFDPAELIDDPGLRLLTAPLPTMSSLLRRSTFLASGGFNEVYRCFEDGDLHLRLALLGARITAIPEVLEWSLRGEGSLSCDKRYCFRCRLAFLEDYAKNLPPRMHEAIAREAERAAIMLLRFSDPESANRAALLAARLGRPLPASNSLLLRLLRRALPVTLLLQWQDRWRNRRAMPTR
jgi:glycosyltransferase involved in cell wall biosynthesis